MTLERSEAGDRRCRSRNCRNRTSIVHGKDEDGREQLFEGIVGPERSSAACAPRSRGSGADDSGVSDCPRTPATALGTL